MGAIRRNLKHGLGVVDRALFLGQTQTTCSRQVHSARDRNRLLQIDSILRPHFEHDRTHTSSAFGAYAEHERHVGRVYVCYVSAALDAEHEQNEREGRKDDAAEVKTSARRAHNG